LCAGAATAFRTGENEVAEIVGFNFWVPLQKRVSRVMSAGKRVGVRLRAELG
jgi:hypothetical protein